MFSFEVLVRAAVEAGLACFLSARALARLETTLLDGAAGTLIPFDLLVVRFVVMSTWDTHSGLLLGLGTSSVF